MEAKAVQNNNDWFLTWLVLSLIFVLSLLGGCKPLENTVYFDMLHENTVYDILIEKDTVLEYPTQNNSVIVVRKSYLKTDLAQSNAMIDSLGFLHHDISNFGFVPSKKIEKKRIEKENNQITKTNNITKTVTITKVRDVKVRDSVWWIGMTGLILFFSALVYKLYKFFK